MEDQNQRDEECRIAYVGVTRAKKHLHIIREGRPGTPRMEMP
jgi:superfamily I DNA/RNA helicase